MAPLKPKKSKPARQSTSTSTTTVKRSKTKRGKPRRLHASKTTNNRPDITIHGGIQAGRNLVDALGGSERLIQILEDSDHPKAQQLIDRLQSSAHIGESFAASYTSVGLKAIHILEIFQDVQQARVFINALTEGDAVMRSLIRAAKDDIQPHDKCNATGYVLDKQGNETGDQCLKCKGSGYILLPGSRESQQLYFELLKWKQQGSLVNIDARKQQANIINTGNQPLLAQPGDSPDVTSIIKRADQLKLDISQYQFASTHTHDKLEQMPEDVIEVEPI